MNAHSLFAAQAWHTAGWTMLHFLWAGAIAGAVGLVCRAVMRRVGPSWAYAASLGTLLALALLPLAIAVRISARPTPRPTPDVRQVAVPSAALHSAEPIIIELSGSPSWPAYAPPTGAAPIIEIPGRATPQQPEASSPSAHFAPSVGTHYAAPQARDAWTVHGASSIVSYLPWLWLVGAPLTFLATALGLTGAERWRRQSRSIEEGPERAACDRIAKALGVGRRVGLAVCDRCVQPLLVGVVRPFILLPTAAVNGWTMDELEMVLWHELAHVRRWDNLVNLFQRMIEAALFFHPIVWLVSRQVRRDREECCDAVVVARTARPQAYAALLLRFAALDGGPFAPSGAALARHPVGQRIRRILHVPREPLRLSRTAIVGGLTALVLLPWGWGRVAALQEASAQQSAEVRDESDKEESAVDDGPTANFSAVQTENAAAEVTAQSIEAHDVARESAPRAADSVPGAWDSVGGAADGVPGAADSVPGAADSVHGAADSAPAGAYGDLPADSRDTETPPAGGPFLTPEDQRAADLAYRALGIELEPLDESELARVRELKFNGGLRVSHVNSNPLNGDVRGHGFGFAGERPTLQHGDLLVGLHSWPTTSHKGVASILQRSDLFAMSPLKYYVVRAVPIGEDADSLNRPTPLPTDDPLSREEAMAAELPEWREEGPPAAIQADKEGGFGDPGVKGSSESYRESPQSPRRVDRLVTGRINVDREAVDEWRRGQSEALHETVTSPFPVANVPRAPAPPLTTIRPFAPGLLGAPDASPEPVLTPVPDTNPAPVLGPQPVPPPASDAAIAPGHAEAFGLTLALAPTLAPVPPAAPGSPSEAAPGRAEDAPSTRRYYPRSVFETRIIDGKPVTVERRVMVPAPDLAEYSAPITYRYQGKSFDEWRTVLQYELSAEPRTEAVRALVAFGRTELGKEAADAILEIVAQYDWTQWAASDEKTKALGTECIRAFGGHVEGMPRASLPPEACRAALLEIMASDNRQKLLFSTHIVGPFLEGEVVDAWLKLTHSDDLEVRSAALVNPFIQRPTPDDPVNKQLDPRVQQRMDEFFSEYLKNGNPEVLRSHSLLNASITPEQCLQMLLSKHDQLQRVGRSCFSEKAIGGDEAFVGSVAAQLIKQIPKFDEHWLAAVRALYFVSERIQALPIGNELLMSLEAVAREIAPADGVKLDDAMRTQLEAIVVCQTRLGMDRTELQKSTAAKALGLEKYAVSEQAKRLKRIMIILSNGEGDNPNSDLKGGGFF